MVCGVFQWFVLFVCSLFMPLAFVCIALLPGFISWLPSGPCFRPCFFSWFRVFGFWSQLHVSIVSVSASLLYFWCVLLLRPPLPCAPRSLVSRPCCQTCTRILQAACIVHCRLHSLVSSFLAAGRAVTACRGALHVFTQILLSVVQLQPGDPGAACIVHCSLHSSLLGKYVLCCRTCSRNLPPPLHMVAQVLLSVEQSQPAACFVRSCPSWGSLHCALSPALIAHAGRAVAACRLHCILSLKSCSPWSSRSLVPALRGHAHRILHCFLHSS